MTSEALQLENCSWKLETQARALEEQAFPLQGVWACGGHGGHICGHQELLP